MSKYSKINFVYFLQKWMDSVPGQTFLNYAYSWGAAIVILGTLFKLTHLPGANVMLFIGMGTEVIVFFISAFDRPFDKSTIDMNLDNHMDDEVIDNVSANPLGEPTTQTVVVSAPSAAHTGNGGATVVSNGGATVVGGSVPSGGTVIIGGGTTVAAQPASQPVSQPTSQPVQAATAPVSQPAAPTPAPAEPISFDSSEEQTTSEAPRVITPAPAVSQETAVAMEAATTAYVERLEQLNETLQKVEALSARLATDSEEMENLNRTLTGIARVYEMQLKSASQQITTQDSINEQTQIMADKIKELNTIYARMIEAMTTNMPRANA